MKNTFFNEQDLFISGEGYSMYRIPGIVVTENETVIAYCEARTGSSDWSSMDIQMRRSTDGGDTWEPMVKLEDGLTTNSVKNNPVMIAENDSNTVHFLYCKDYASAFYRKSIDAGATWSESIDITYVFDKFKTEYDWKVIATGPAHGIKLNEGRILVPVWLATNMYHHPSVVSTIYSDDNGATWNRGEIIWNSETITDPSETTAIQLYNGSVMLNIRNESNLKRRVVTTSKEGNTNWSTPCFDNNLPDPICLGSIVRFTDKKLYHTNRILFLNCHSTSSRENLTVKLSTDEGESWEYSKVVHEGDAAYSDIAVSRNKNTIYCLYERDEYKYLTLARFNLEWITDGIQSLDPKG